MANPTAAVPTRQVQWAQSEQRRVYLQGNATETIYYPNEMIGVADDGYHAKFDDTQSMRFVGIVAESVRVVQAAGDADGANSLVVSQPRFFTMLTSGGAVTDKGRYVYASFSNQCALLPGTYGNLIGEISKYVSATEYEISPFYTKRPRGGYIGQRLLAATGTITLSAMDIGKIIQVRNTAAQTINLPALADVDVGEGFLFVKGSGGTFTATLDGSGSETINGATTSATMTADYKYVEIIKNQASSGSYEWSIIRSN